MAQVSITAKLPTYCSAHIFCSSTLIINSPRPSLRCRPPLAAIATPKTYPKTPAASASGPMVSAAASVTLVLAALPAGAPASSTVRTRSAQSPHNPLSKSHDLTNTPTKQTRVNHLRDKGYPHPEGGESCGSDCMVHGLITCFTGLGWILQIPLRNDVRERYRIRGSGGGDW